MSKEVIQSVAEGGQGISTVVRRLQFGVRILNEYNITNKIDEAMIEAGRRDLSRYDQYLPLIGSFNNLCDAACRVKTSSSKSEAVEEFLFAAMAFGLEVGLWTVGVPYKMAWKGTLFVANRTFLRFARYGCRGCIAAVMSELHWAIRGTIYGEAVTESNVEFVSNQIGRLRTKADDLEYDVDLKFDKREFKRTLESDGQMVSQDQGPIERLTPDISVKVPSVSELLDEFRP